MGLPYKRHNVGGSYQGLDSPEYLQLNPNGRIPTLQDGDHVLYESNAIIRYLCRIYGKGTILPDSEQQIAIADQWMEWYKTTPYPKYIDLFWAIVRTEPALRNEEQIAKLAKEVAALLTVLDQHLSKNNYVLGNEFSMGDIPLGALMHRYFCLDVERPPFTNIMGWYDLLCEREAYKEHVMFKFGSNPAEWYRYEMAPEA